jgi:hypothetical protein
MTFLKWKLEHKRVLSNFHGRAGSVIGWRENLHARSDSTPRTLHSEAAEAKVTPYLAWSSEQRAFDFLADPFPLGGIESRTGLNGHDLLVAKGKADAARWACEWKIKDIGLAGGSVTLARSPDALVEQNPQFG